MNRCGRIKPASGGIDLGSMFKKRNLWLLTIAVSIGVMALIAYFSAQPAEKSNDLSEGISGKVLALVQIAEPDVTLEELNHFLRKLAHFTLYFILGCSLMCAFSGQKRISPILAAVLVGAAFAASDELQQMLSDGRNASVQDVILDTCGVTVGSVLSWILLKELRKKN